MEPPDYKTRVRILQKKSQTHGYQVPYEVMEYLADNLVEDVRQLESGLNNVAMKSSLLGIPVDLSLAADIVRHMSVARGRITLDAIKQLICREYGVLEKDLMSRSRKQRLTWPRQVGIFLSRRFTDRSLKEIGRCYNRYHATVIHSVNCVESATKSKRSAMQEIELLSKKIEEGKL
jgi:chromosomal replication initiator protein